MDPKASGTKKLDDPRRRRGIGGNAALNHGATEVSRVDADRLLVREVWARVCLEEVIR